MAGSIKKAYKKILKTPFFMKIVSFLIFCYAKLVFVTCKWEYRGADELVEEIKKADAIIAACWHGRIVFMPFVWNKFFKNTKYKIRALVSLHQDGQLIANILRMFGVGIIDGSTNNNSKAAAVNLMKTLNESTSIVIVPDGPTGPSMRMTKSPIYYAKKSGKPIFGAMFSIENSKLANKSWDQTLIPKPFSKAIFQIVGPYYVPDDATDEMINEYCQKIENEMNEALLSIDKELGLPRVEIGKMHKKKLKKKIEENA